MVGPFTELVICLSSVYFSIPISYFNITDIFKKVIVEGGTMQKNQTRSNWSFSSLKYE